MKKPNLTLTHNLIKQLLGKTSKGVFAIAWDLVVSYFNSKYCKNKYKYEQDYSYFHSYREWNLVVDLASWITSSYDNKRRYFKFNFKKQASVCDEELRKERERVFNLWKQNKLKRELHKITFVDTTMVTDKGVVFGTEQQDKELYQIMLKCLNSNFPKYKQELELEFKKEIGLC